MYIMRHSRPATSSSPVSPNVINTEQTQTQTQQTTASQGQNGDKVTSPRSPPPSGVKSAVNSKQVTVLFEATSFAIQDTDVGGDNSQKLPGSYPYGDHGSNGSQKKAAVMYMDAMSVGTGADLRSPPLPLS
ncbi:hypothetical protein BGZ65_011735 [Modicella reniformis]|uniref:Uncharacterized protein n=1 Tax=Modicella reniformis TaxID=1440133 RepID=A0A9P6JI54_9FUNG|nr:hypothetical protein BGZ65_011735 [Modicella reniformis]